MYYYVVLTTIFIIIIITICVCIIVGRSCSSTKLATLHLRTYLRRRPARGETALTCVCVYIYI